MAERTGKMPQTLLDKPKLPWYYGTFITHFSTMSASRSFRSDVRINPKGQPYYVTAPNPIDISVMLSYNEHIAKMDNPLDFIGIIQALDSIFISHDMKKRSG